MLATPMMRERKADGLAFEPIVKAEHAGLLPWLKGGRAGERGNGTIGEFDGRRGWSPSVIVIQML